MKETEFQENKLFYKSRWINLFRYFLPLFVIAGVLYFYTRSIGNLCAALVIILSLYSRYNLAYIKFSKKNISYYIYGFRILRLNWKDILEVFQFPEGLLLSMETDFDRKKAFRLSNKIGSKHLLVSTDIDGFDEIVDNLNNQAKNAKFIASLNMPDAEEEKEGEYIDRGANWKQVDELTLDDLKKHSVWQFCLDYEGVDDVDEATVRPSPERETVNPKEALYVVKANFVLKDGTEYLGYLTPLEKSEKNGIGIIQPTIITKNGQVSFWKVDKEERNRNQQILGKDDDVFPIQYKSHIKTTGQKISGEITKYY